MSSGLLQFFSTADNITAIAAASYVLWSASSGVYRRTLGSRSRTARALHSLTPGNPKGMVESLFGLPVYAQPRTTFDRNGSRSEPDGERCLYNAKHGWLTVHFRDERVIAFAFMLTDRGFRFRLAPTSRGIIRGHLGRTPYAQLWPDPVRVQPDVGAYNWGYSELHSFGRGGNYQDYVLSNTMHGWSRGRPVGGFPPLLEKFIRYDASQEWEDIVERWAPRYRAVNAPDTVAVFGVDYVRYTSERDHDFDAFIDSGAFDQDDMRNLEGEGPQGWLSRSSFERRERRLRLLRIGQKRWPRA